MNREKNDEQFQCDSSFGTDDQQFYFSAYFEWRRRILYIVVTTFDPKELQFFSQFVRVTFAVR